MGKSKKGNKIVTSFKSSQGLEDQITEGRVVKSKSKKHKEAIKLRYDEEDNEYIDPKTTQRILNAAQKQRAELAKEFGPTPGEAQSRGLYNSKKFTADSDDSEPEQFDNDDKEEYTEHDFFDDLKMNDEDERALEMFQNK